MPTSEYSQDTERTTDVQTHDQTPFSMVVTNSPRILEGLTVCNYIHASPIQVAAIPTIIAGNDTIVEAKNGTGKTLSFVIPTLVRLKVDQSHLQTIVLAPTREIAVQIQQCFKKVGQFLPDLKCEYFIGGTSVEIDKEKANGCQIAVGSPGRIKHLLNEHVLKGSEVKTFILDEVDRLFTDKNFTKDVRLIDSKLPKLKQMIVVSASIDKKDMSVFDEFMKEYIVVKGAEEDMNASQDPSKFLLGIKQYVACVRAVSTNIILLPAKNVRLLNILQNLPYTQCIIFTNYMTRVEAVCNMLRDQNYKADYIRGDQDQNIRLKLVDRLTSFKSRILVATDLIARGIDSSNVDLVINMDCPNDWATYLHRIGRAGRFGNKGSAFTILDDDKELKSFKHIINNIESVKIKVLPIVIEKPIFEYADNELEDLNLTVESDLEVENIILEESGNKIVEDNEQSNPKLKCNEFLDKLNANSVSVCIKPEKEIKCVYGPGISEKESLEKLCEVVKETEKELIENNLVNKKRLSDRSFILFDPEPYLDDSDQYSKLSPEQLKEILKQYKIDIKKNGDDEKSMCEKDSDKKSSNNSHVCLDNDLSNQSNNTNEKTCDTDINQQSLCKYEAENDSEKKMLTDEVCSDSNLSNKSDGDGSTTNHANTRQQPRFTNIFDLFQVPDFSDVKPIKCEKLDDCSTNEQSSNKEESDESYTISEKYIKQEQYDEEDEEESDETYTISEKYINQEQCDEEEEENDVVYFTDEELFELKENSEFDVGLIEENSDFEETIENNYCNFDKSSNDNEDDANRKLNVERYYKCFKSIQENTMSNNIQENDMASQRVVNETNDDKQLLDYDVLKDWYQQWRQQMHVIQTFVKMSK